MNELGRYNFIELNTVNELIPENTIIDKERIELKVQKIVKRAIDICGSLIGVMILIPLTFIIYIANLFNKDNAPIFYFQERIGKDGKKFKICKFRTMYIDADTKLNKILDQDENLRKEWDEHRKLKNDPRVTKIGKILRKTSIDEFPNFINVLIGSMSLVGPRAVVPDELEKFGEYKNKVLSVKPGVTGYWAANGRSNTTYEERVKMEVKYVEDFSIWLDIKLIIKTIFKVIIKEGAR